MPATIADFSATQDSRDEVLVRLIHRGNENFNHGRYLSAERLFDQAMGMIDLLMAAHGAWLSAERASEGPAGAPPAQLAQTLVSLAHLSDQILKCQARTSLASHFGQALSDRDVPQELAGMATGHREVESLLASEEDRLHRLLQRSPKNTEMHYRLGLLARARGEHDLARREFERALSLAPDHSESAVRLAATLLEQGDTATAADVLHRVPRVELRDLWQYYQWEIAAEDDAKFNHILEELEQTPPDQPPSRPNLAYSVGEELFPPNPYCA